MMQHFAWAEKAADLTYYTQGADPAELLELAAVITGRSVRREHIGGEGHAIGELLARMRGSRIVSANGGKHQLFAWDWCVATLSIKDGDNVSVSLVGAGDEGLELFELLCAALRKNIVARPSQGTMHILAPGMGGFSLRSVGRVESPLVRTNYAADVLVDYDHIVGCLQARDPCGRIAVLDGTPGTGKSFLIRALAAEVQAIFVLVAPSLVGHLSGPDVMPCLCDAKQENNDVPVVLILEDADSILVRRQEGDRVALAGILNLGDGLLGQLMDVRIIATTNAKITEMDEAIVRPGRLCRRISTTALRIAQATRIYQHLCPRGRAVWLTAPTLAEVYRRARIDGWNPEGSISWKSGGTRPGPPPPAGNYL